MSTKTKRTAGNICSGNEIVSFPKEEFFDSFQDKIKSYQVKNEYLTLFITYIFILSLAIDKVYSNEDFIFNKMLNINAFMILHRLSQNVHKNNIFSLISLCLLLAISNIYLYLSNIAQFLIIYIIYIILSGYYEINFVNFYFNELILYNEAFQ